MTDPERPVIPDRSEDDSDRGWGDDRPGDSDTDAHEEWLRRQRPPHHGG
ncbi:hypothetical protein [Sporichthya polymorpha]|nr:hypothetical protein [Sporichthya polymorpha]